MRVFLAGICGTFMGGIAQLARARGYAVSGCDANVYPPMSTLLESLGIEVLEGYEPAFLDNDYDQIVIGNALTRGNPLVEAVLDGNYPFVSGPQWLHDQLLMERRVAAVAGTHGKTTTSGMVNWIMHESGKQSGYLIGGKPGNFDHSAAIGSDEWFVIEADEYDTAFFDKRSKFVHYRPEIAILNNIEFDHADIFSDLDQIKTQFHHLVRIVPSRGLIIANHDDANVRDVLEIGCWSSINWFSVLDESCRWFAKSTDPVCSRFEVFQEGRAAGIVEWPLIGKHNMQNGLAAIAASAGAGIDVGQACGALATFSPAARRLQLLYGNDDVFLYEDFAHHPTAIALTLEAVRMRHPGARIIVVVELRSNTMKEGCHGDQLGRSFNQADTTCVYQPADLGWDPRNLPSTSEIHTVRSFEELMGIPGLSGAENAVIICMSNGSFDGIPGLLREHLESNLVKGV